MTLRVGNIVDGKTLCGCIEDGRPCAKRCGLDMSGWLCEEDSGLRQEYPNAVPASPKGKAEPPKEDTPERKLLIAAYDALRSYQYGNESTKLAEEIANAIGRYFSGGKQ